MSAIVKDVMSTHVIAVRKSATYKEMATRLREMHVSAFPVLDDDDKVIGVVSEGDLLIREALGDRIPPVFTGMLGSREQAKATGITAADLMTAPPVTIGPDDTVAHAAHLMYDYRVKRLPVVGGDGRLIGIVTRSDVLSVYDRADDDIRREVTDSVIQGTFGSDPARFTVTVKDGIVTLEGTPETAAAGRDIVDAVKHAQGVVAVRDQLTYPEP
ncbi:MAG TPA: CBS domain-containing protein [Streptosporangiaceae bacterium]